MARDSQQTPSKVDHNTDRFPTLKEGLRRILGDDTVEDITIDRLDVRYQANGEVAFRYWEPRAEEPNVGFLPDPRVS